MDTASISAAFEEQIGERKIIAAVFTTYTFEPDFFELEVIPLMLKNQHSTYVSDPFVKRFLVRDALRKENLPIDVFYDAPVFSNNNQSDSPQMDYLCHGVDLRGSAFHPKLIFLLVDDGAGHVTLLIGAGSNNLTLSGWWRSIECQRWVEVGRHDTQRYDLDRYIACINYLKLKQNRSVDKKTAIDQVVDFLLTCTGKRDAPYHFFYGPYDETVPSRGFIAYLEHEAQLLNYNEKYTLEILSPFFPEDTKSPLHTEFLKATNIKSINLFLPTDAEGRALCEEAYFKHINESEGIQWCDWTPEIKKKLGITKDCHRHLHAKVFRFYNGRSSTAFTGSVNLSNKAFLGNKSSSGNAEAGFVSKWQGRAPLLEPITDLESIQFAQNIPDPFPSLLEDIDEARPKPIISITFDWVKDKLLGYVEGVEQAVITIQGAEGESLHYVSRWSLCNEPSEFTGDKTALKKHLQTNSLVTIVDSSRANEKFNSYIHLVQQVGWSHKQLDIDHLSADQIIAIYAGMSPEQRQMLLVNAKIKHLIQHGYSGESHLIKDDDIPKGFFCEYAEIFHAFIKLKEQLYKALEDKNFLDLDYYLTGAGVDSIPSLVDRALQEDSEGKSEILDGVTAYLILLLCKDILELPEFKGRENVGRSLEKIKKEILQIKTSGRIQLQRDNPEVFFAWFEEYFFMELRQSASEYEEAINE